MSAYLTAVLADNPIHYWRCCDPATGVLNDVGSVPIALITNANFASLGFSGPVSDGGSFYSDSNDDAVFRDTENWSTPLTLELWFWQHYVRGQTQALFDIEQAGVTALILPFVISSGALQVNAGASHLTTTTFPQIQRWHHLVVTRSASLTTIYLDSVNIGSFASAAQASVPCQFALGAAVGDTSISSANFSEVALYSSALSSARVAAHYAAADRRSQPPVGNAAGGTSGSGVSVSDPNYVGILQQILQAVRSKYENTP